MSIRTEIAALEHQIEDLEQVLAVAQNEQTGRESQILARIGEVRERINHLIPFAEPLVPAGGRMQGCSGCGRPFWPESLTEGRCEMCGPLGGEGPSESIQTGDLKRRRAPKS